MQILFASVLFVIAVLGLGYLPGKLILLLLGRKVSPLEGLSLSCSVGLLISGLVYWAVTYLNQERYYVLWPLGTAVIFACYCLKAGKRAAFSQLLGRAHELDGHRRDWSVALLGVVMALGVTMLALLPQYYTNLTLQQDGTMKVHAVPDVFFHLAIANELTHAIPPQAPIFAGRPLNYHYGMDLVVAMFENVTRLTTPDLLLRLVPTLFLILSLTCVYCFARDWLDSGYFGALVAFLVFFGEDFSFIPGLLLGEKGDWSVRFFNVPTVLSLFFTNAMLPAVGLLFAGLFCLRAYLRERSRSWLLLSAILFVGLVEVKLFTAVQIMCCLGIAAIAFLLLFRKTELFIVAALTALLTAPLVLSVFLHNRTGADIITSLSPWPYVSIAMARFGLRGWFTGPLGFGAMALPIYLVGCFGLRVIAVPAIVAAIIQPKPASPLRFVLALFVTFGAIVTLLVRIVPASSVNSYNNSVWFLAQSKYVAWLFTVEIIQRFYGRLSFSSKRPLLVAVAITAVTLALTIPSTVQHFSLELNPELIYGKSVSSVQTYSKAALELIAALNKNSRPGDVVLADETLRDPVLALTKCRVPLGYFSNFLVSHEDFTRRLRAETTFWKDWRTGRVDGTLLREADVRYIVLDRRIEGMPKMLPANLKEAFSNSEYELLQVEKPASTQ